MQNVQNNLIHPCRICGYNLGSPVFRDEFDVCDSCGVEITVQDEILEDIRIYRQKWLLTGPKWWGPCPPLDWNVAEQMKNIPLEFL